LTAPLSWLLLVALALLGPAKPHGAAVWTKTSPAVISRPGQPISGRPLVLVVAGLPHAADHVVITGTPTPLPAQRRGPGVYRADLTAPAPGPLSLVVRFSYHGRRYQSPVGVLFVQSRPALK